MSQASSSRQYKYTKVLDNRKHPIRGLWRRNGKFRARITVEDDAGRKLVRWVSLEAATVAEAQKEFRELLVERSENRLRQIGLSPTFSEFYTETYLPILDSSGKKAATLVTEKGHYKRWVEALGHLRLDKIRPSHILEALNKLRLMRSPRTCNLALVCLRHVMKAAKRDGYLKTLPTADIEWQRTETKARRLHTLDDIKKVCAEGIKVMAGLSRSAPMATQRTEKRDGWTLTQPWRHTLRQCPNAVLRTPNGFSQARSVVPRTRLPAPSGNP
jgi:hypothetical protein